MVLRCWPGIWRNMQWSDHTCLRCCGVCLYWLPRVSVPFSIVWGVLSHINYSLELTNTAVGTSAAVIGTLAGVLAFIAYYHTWKIGPGSPTEFPELVVTDPESSVGLFPDGGVPNSMQNCNEAKHDGGVRFCSKCQCFKPDRTHHCRHCGTCVLRMDHHCPWFSTCVGFRNHKYFIQFLWYVWLLCASANVVAFPTVLSFFDNEMYNTKFIGINFVFYLMLSAVFSLVLFVFAGYTTWLAATNKTTLESLEPNAYRTSLPANQWRYRQPPTRESIGNIYDIGITRNLEQIMGTTWLEWLLPIRSRFPVNGIQFPINEEVRMRAEDRAQTEIAMHQRKRQWQLNQEAEQASSRYYHEGQIQEQQEEDQLS